jgi:hypothetical protein
LANKIGSYTAYLTAKFCYLKDEVHFARELEELNKSVERHIIRSSLNFKEDTQLYLLVCDLISAPDVDVQRKQRVLDHVLAKERASGTIGHITASTATELARLVGFVDWYGVRLRHTLARRQLRGAREY